jgi:organic hydroperoxide reductase OsmC/OhrA
MKSYPHRYSASASGRADGEVTLASPSLPPIVSAPPPEFDGPVGLWSPETLLTAAVANCILLTFRAVARAAHFEWLTLECSTEGVLDRIDGVTQFASFATVARLGLPAGASEEKARKLLEKAERDCLVTNSLRGTRTMQIEVMHARAAQRA